MRTVGASLLAEQKKHAVDPVAKYTIITGETRGTAPALVGYEYREMADQTIRSDIYFDYTPGYEDVELPHIGDPIDLERGLRINGVAYYAELPRVWVESIEYHEDLTRVICLDFWGRLRAFRQGATYTYTATDAQDIIDDILDAVGLTRIGGVTGNTINFTITRNERYDVALRRVCSRIYKKAYTHLNGQIKFKTLSSSDAADYEYDRNADHPYREMQYTQSAWRYNRIRAVGALDYTGVEYWWEEEDTDQQALVGIRFLAVRDVTLISEAACEARSLAELAYYEALSTHIELEALPCHGLEMYDMIQIPEIPGGSVSSVKSRVKSYIERYGPGDHQQEIKLLPPSSDTHVEPANLPEWLIADDAETSAKVGPAALDAFQLVGAAVRGTDAESDYDTAEKCAAEFLQSAGRLPQIGDTLLVWNDDTSEWRLYAYESDDPADQWVYVTITGSV